MRFDQFIKNWKALLVENFFLKVATILMLIGLILNGTFFKKDTIVTISPPEVREEFWIGKAEASEEYIEQMAVFFATLGGNLSPTNAAYNVNALLQYVTPGVYGDIKSSLMGEALSIIENNVTQAFFPNDVKVDGMTAAVKGETVRKIGSAKPVTERVMYTMKFLIHNYKIYLDELYIDYPDKAKRRLITKKSGVADREQIKKKFEEIEKEMKDQ